jgi:predicted RecA/RadA family phage recombinase
MAKFIAEPDTRRFTNGTGAKLNNGDLVQLPDAMAGIVQGLAGVANGATGNVQTTGIISITKAVAATAITVGARIQVATATQLASAKVGAADSGNFIVGRAILASGAGVVEVQVDLNGQGPTI